MSNADTKLAAIMQEAAALMQERDLLAANLHWTDHKLTDLCRDYGEHMRTWGWTPHMMRQALKARGYLKEDQAA